MTVLGSQTHNRAGSAGISTGEYLKRFVKRADALPGVIFRNRLAGNDASGPRVSAPIQQRRRAYWAAMKPHKARPASAGAGSGMGTPTRAARPMRGTPPPMVPTRVTPPPPAA